MMGPMEYNKLVLEVAKEVDDLIVKRADATDLSVKGKFLLVGRIINCIFASHFNMMARQAHTAITNAEKEDLEKP